MDRSQVYYEAQEIEVDCPDVQIEDRAGRLRRTAAFGELGGSLGKRRDQVTVRCEQTAVDQKLPVLIIELRDLDLGNDKICPREDHGGTLRATSASEGLVGINVADQRLLGARRSRGCRLIRRGGIRRTLVFTTGKHRKAEHKGGGK